MSEYATPTYLLANGRLSELLGSLPLDESVTVTVSTPMGEYEVTACRVGVTVFMLAAGQTLTVRALSSEAHAVMFMDAFRAVVDGSDAEATAEIQAHDFMIV